MILPTIHTNGTSREELIDQAAAVQSALYEVTRRMGDATPNGRDYYTQGDDALKTAMAEHHTRVEKVSALIQEMQKFIDGIDQD